MGTYSEHMAYYEAFGTGYWADEDPEKCKCKGTGYALSEVDTWHACPAHFVKGQAHPEDEPSEFDNDVDDGNCKRFHPADVCMSMAQWEKVIAYETRHDRLEGPDDDNIPF